MSKTSIISNFIGGQTKATYPNIQGSALSINMYSEKNGELTYQKSIPGLRHIYTLSNTSGKCQGMYVPSSGETGYNPALFAVFGNTVYKVSSINEEATVIGYVTSGSKCIFSETGGERPFLLIADGTCLWIYNLKEGGNLEQANLPLSQLGNQIRPTYVQCVNGSIIINDKDSGFAYYSEPYPLSKEKREVYDLSNGQIRYDNNKEPIMKTVDSKDWIFLNDYGAVQYKNGESNSDEISALYAIGSNLIVFGPKSVEFWQRGSADYENWTRTSYTFNREVGLNSVYSVASVNNTVCFVSNGQNSGKGVFSIANTSLTKISPTWLDNLLCEYECDNIIGYTYSISNHAFYILQVPETGSLPARTLCYDMNTQEWSERSSHNNDSDEAWNPLYSAWFENKIVFGSRINGNINVLDEKYYKEDIDEDTSIPLVRVRQTPVIVNNYQPFTFDELSIEMNTGSITEYDINPEMTLFISEDGGYTFSSQITETCGKTGQYFYRVRFLSLGMQRTCVLKITYSEESDLVISNSSIRVTPMSYSI